jgi:hypothetical protein
LVDKLNIVCQPAWLSAFLDYEDYYSLLISFEVGNRLFNENMGWLASATVGNHQHGKLNENNFILLITCIVHL